jgi:hypothetical protein
MSDNTRIPQFPGDHQAWEVLMPFYLAHTLPVHEAHALEAHLLTCAICRESLEDWRAIANATHQVATQRGYETPPLSASLRQQIYHEASQRRQGTQQIPLPPLRVMPRQTEHQPPAATLMPPGPIAKGRSTQHHSSPWLTRIAAVLVFVIAAGIVVNVTRETLLTLTADPTQGVVMLSTATETLTPQLQGITETTLEVTQQTEQVESQQPTATPWNTVLPIRPSLTPTFTITPQPTIATKTADAGNPAIDATPTVINPTVIASIVASVTPSADRTTRAAETAVMPLLDTAPTIQQFSVVPNTVQPGQTVTVRWQTSGAAHIEIAADYAGTGRFMVVHETDVSTNIVPLTLPQDVREQVVFELRLYGFDDTEAAETSTAVEVPTLMPISLLASEQVSVAIQCPYIYLLYGNQCPDASVTQLTGTVQRFEHGWIIRRNDLGEGLVLFDNGTVSANIPAQATPQGTAPAGLFSPDPVIIPFYQTALGWAQAPAKEVMLHVSKVDADLGVLVHDESQWFAVQLYAAPAEPVMLSFEIEWLPVNLNTDGNFTLWRSVS